MAAHFVRQRWLDGTYARLAWVTIPDPQLVDTVAASGRFDAVVIDVQHGPFHQQAILEAARAAGRWPVTLLARIASPDADLIGWILDAGVDGVIVAMCESVDDAERIVRAVRYAPEGSRSYGVYRVQPAGHDPFAAANEAIVLPMIESAAGLQHAAAIAAVAGVDGLFIGPGDLGLSLGHGVGQNRTEPAMVEAFAAIRSAAGQFDRRCGIFATTADYARQTAAEGFDIVVPWVDAPAIAASLAAASMP
jgi:4-hydroxy-2-oxoheptanedioate aldolase